MGTLADWSDSAGAGLLITARGARQSHRHWLCEELEETREQPDWDQETLLESHQTQTDLSPSLRLSRCLTLAITLLGNWTWL